MHAGVLMSKPLAIVRVLHQLAVGAAFEVWARMQRIAQRIACAAGHLQRLLAGSCWEDALYIQLQLQLHSNPGDQTAD
jgi:hypothetical protein